MTRRTELVMGGMPFTVAVCGDADPALIDAVFAEVRRIEAVFSPFRPASAVARLAAGVAIEDDADAEVRRVLAACRAFGDATGGYFSAWASGALDPCGLVKGWAIRRVSDMLAAGGHAHHFVDGGGDVLARGLSPASARWRVGIRHPVVHERVISVVAVSDLAVATSGTYERGAHIIDPHTGIAATELVSLTVVGPDIVAADAYATAAFAMGRHGIAFVEGLAGYEALAVDRELFAATTSGFDALAA